MALFIKVMLMILKITLGKGLANKYGRTVLDTLVTGTVIKLMDWGSSGMLTEIFTKGVGSMIKQMATVFTSTRMEPSTKAHGRMICKMVRALRLGLMAVSTMVVIRKE